MVGAWVTRSLGARFVDVVGLLWIAFEWRPYRRPRLVRSPDGGQAR